MFSNKTFLNYKNDFPILQQKVNGHDLVYLDSAATCHSPQAVIDAHVNYYSSIHSNVHSGLHYLSEKAYTLYENSRIIVAEFIKANNNEIVFCSSATVAINQIVFGYARHNIERGSEIIISAMEHHSNIIPWQILAKELDLSIKVIPVTKDNDLDFSAYLDLLSDKTSFVAVSHISNVLGVVNPVAKITEAAKKYGAKVLIDGAQAVAHTDVDVKKIDCDFYVFSAHKIYGPTGIGVLYLKQEYLETMSPYYFGGGMISEVDYTKSTFLSAMPKKFEAGTPNISGVITLGAAINYFTGIGKEKIFNFEDQLFDYAVKSLSNIQDVKILANSSNKTAVISFLLGDIHSHDIASLLDQHGIAVRAGHHCAMPLLKTLDLKTVTRVSLAIYNDKNDIDKLCEALVKVRSIFQ